MAGDPCTSSCTDLAPQVRAVQVMAVVVLGIDAAEDTGQERRLLEPVGRAPGASHALDHDHRVVMPQMSHDGVQLTPWHLMEIITM